ncbi:hypothetical protein PCH_Pc18g04670 [Penicillium rubens Wisconsin 54-1255]|uniref:Uncharacterized protein n=1 Tax=Penicillium rubens (strain ATCC 28089 / DSM 1075 / NRRL 1951 / Wisconsin 54-1255) TaxID=500485 RepID=B6HBR1_PENRW|nr:hypothetical protein PCH_Pc18g04670 [Penicillium rubens Wisconsin 54-1255]
MSLLARSIPFKYRRGFRERSRVDLQMWGAAMGLADGLVSIDTGFVAIAVDEMVAGLVQGKRDRDWVGPGTGVVGCSMKAEHIPEIMQWILEPWNVFRTWQVGYGLATAL